jgi:hypothetical protein
LLAVLCTYPLAACVGGEILDVVRTHQFAVAQRRGNWDVIETAGHKQAKAEIKRLNDELEQRVIRAEARARDEGERLRQAQADMAHINRVSPRSFPLSWPTRANWSSRSAIPVRGCPLSRSSRRL